MQHADRSCEVETLDTEMARELTEAELAGIYAGAGTPGQGNMGGAESGLGSLGGLGQALNLSSLVGSLGNLGGLGGALGGGGL